MKLSSKIIGKKYSSYTRATQISLILFALSGCGGGDKGSNLTAQNQALSEFKQREAIVLAAIHEDKPVVIPASLKTFYELQNESEGAYGSKIGRPAVKSLDTLLTGQSCVLLNDPFAVTTFGNSKSTLEIEKISDSVSTERSTAIKAALSGGTALISVKASADFQNSALFSKSSIGFVIRSGISGTHDKPYLNTESLETFFKPQYLSQGNLNQSYYGLCGDSFVSAEQYFAGVEAVLTIDLQSDKSASSFDGAIGASYGNFAELSASIKRAESSSKLSGSVTLRVTQLGGIDGEVNKIIPSGIITCSLENYQSCEDVMNQVLNSSSTIGDQIKDPDTKELIKSRITYRDPTTTRYDGMITLSSDDGGDDGSGSRAISVLNDIYLTTLRLYYELENNLSLLKDTSKNEFNNRVITKLMAREKYIIGMSPSCYKSPSECASTYLPKMIDRLNSDTALSINQEDLLFYSKIYTADNFMKLNDVFGSNIDASKHIYTELVPSIISVDKETGVTSYSYVSKAINGCDSVYCQSGAISVTMQPVLDDPKVDHRVTITGFTALVYDCLENSVDGILNCSGHNKDISGGTKYNYIWSDNMTYSYVGGFSSQELAEYAHLRSF